MPTIPSFDLGNGVAMPALGYGVFQIDPAATCQAVSQALDCGYRLIDTASAYHNEQGVGETLARWMAEGRLARDEVFVTTKVWVTQFGLEETHRAVAGSLRRLGLEYADMILLHFPVPSAFEKTLAAYRALEAEQADGRIRAIGVCNFHVHHLQKLMEQCRLVPAVNQVELHPCFNQAALMAFHAQHGIVTQAWSPLGAVMQYDPASLDRPRRLLDEPVLGELARACGKSPAQVVLRWHMQRGVAVIPKSVHRERMVENLDIFDFVLSDEAMARINALDSGQRAALDPDLVTMDTYPNTIED